MELKELQNSMKDTSDINYKGIPIYAAPNLHEKAFDIIDSIYSNRKDAKVLILGSGGGAFDQRMLDFGYKDVTSVDINSKNYTIQGTKFIQFDLNTDFSVLGNYDLIVCLEIIEHVENPYRFMGSIKKILNKGGNLIISTPNIENDFSRGYFLCFGTLDYFGIEELQETGHISPIFDHIFRFFCANHELKVIDKYYNRSVFDRMQSIQSRLFSFIIKSILILKEKNIGEINIYHIGHSD